MFQISHPWWLLGLVIVMVAGEIWRFRQGVKGIELPTLGDPLVPLLAVRQSVLFKTSNLARWFSLFSLAMAIARPVMVEQRPVEEEGIDIYLVLDMSYSMRAVDLDGFEIEALKRRGSKPKTRFEIAKAVSLELIQSRPHDRFGWVSFGQQAFLEFPLTSDRKTMVEILEHRQLGDISGRGTAIGNALARALAGLRHSSSKTRLIILITDGDRQGGTISPQKAAHMAARYGIPIFTLLIGREGERPLISDDQWKSYHPMDYPVNPDLLREIASMSGGKSYRATRTEEFKRDFRDILDRFEKTKFEHPSYRISQDQSEWWIVLFLFFFILSWI